MDADAVRKQKDRAAEFVARGKLPSALEVYRALVRELPGDLSLRQKVADLLNRTGKTRESIAEYDAVVQAYAERGELLKAISIGKVILQIDPSHRATEARLAELYGRQLGEGLRFAASAPVLGSPVPSERNPRAVTPAPVPPPPPPPPPPAPAAPTAARPPSVPRVVRASRPPAPPPPPPREPEPAPPEPEPADAFAATPAVDPFAPVAALPPIVPSAEPPPKPAAPPHLRFAPVRPPVVAPPPPASGDVTRVLQAAPPESGVYFDVLPESRPAEQTDPGAAPDDNPHHADATLLLSGRPGSRSSTPRATPLTMPVLPLPGGGRPIRPSGAPRPARPAPAARPENSTLSNFGADEAPPSTLTGSQTLMLSGGHEESSALHLDLMRDTEARQTSNFLVSRGPAGRTTEIFDADSGFEHATVESSLPIPIPSEPRPAGDVPPLPKIPLFSGIPPEAFMALVAGAQVRTASAGERLLVEGSAGDSLFAIVQGLVTLRKREGRRERPFAAMGPGEFFGELSVVSDVPRLATVIAEDETVLLEFPRAQLQPVLSQHASVKRELERLSRERLLASLLRATPLFDALDAAARERLKDDVELRTLVPDELVASYGQTPDGVSVILRGELSVLDPLAVDGTPPLPDLEEGDLFGVLSSLLGEPLRADLRARTTCVVVRIPPLTLADLLRGQQVMRQLLAALARERWSLLAQRSGSP